MGIKKNKNQLIISIIVGVAIAVISYQVILKLKIENDNLKKLTQTNEQAPIKKNIYVVSKIDVKKGEKIDPQNLSTNRFPVEIEGAITDVSQISGLVANKDIKADTPIIESYFKISQIDELSCEPRNGYRAVGMLIGNDSLPSFAQEGSYVDIYFSKSVLNAQNIRILSIKDVSSGSSKSVMLEIKEKDVPVFIAAASEDKPVLVQRNRNENSGYKFVSASANPTAGVVLSDMSSPPELMEISDISSSDVPPTQNATYTTSKPTSSSASVPLVRSRVQGGGEIEFISGDKKMIIGAPQ